MTMLEALFGFTLDSEAVLSDICQLRGGGEEEEVVVLVVPSDRRLKKGEIP